MAENSLKAEYEYTVRPYGHMWWWSTSYGLSEGQRGFAWTKERAIKKALKALESWKSRNETEKRETIQGKL